MNRIRLEKTKVFAFGTILLWSSAFVFTKIALAYFTTSAVGALRYLIASILFIGIAIYKKIGLPDGKDIPKFFISGAFGFTFYMIAFNQGSSTLTPGTSSVLIATGPIITALLASIFLKEKVYWLGWVAIFVEFIGIIVLTLWNGVLSINEGIFWMFLAAVCISVYNLFQRYYRTKYTALQSTAYNIFTGTFLLLIYLPDAVRQLIHAPIEQWMVILFMGIFPSALAYLWWSKALSMAKKTTEVTNFMFVTPLLATILGFVMIQEVPDGATLLGGGFIIVGLLLFQKSNQKNNM